MVTDPGEVFRLGTAKAEENLAFRRWLSAHHCTESPFQILASQVQAQMDCKSCGNCCRGSVVAVGEGEIRAVAEYLGMTVEAVTHLYTVADPEDSERRVLASEGEGCVFLDGSLCLVYAARPKTCRDFPHVGSGAHTLGSRAASHGRWATVCPIIFNAMEVYKRLVGWRGDGGCAGEA